MDSKNISKLKEIMADYVVQSDVAVFTKKDQLSSVKVYTGYRGENEGILGFELHYNANINKNWGYAKFFYNIDKYNSQSIRVPDIRFSSSGIGLGGLAFYLVSKLGKKRGATEVWVINGGGDGEISRDDMPKVWASFGLYRDQAEIRELDQIIVQSALAKAKSAKELVDITAILDSEKYIWNFKNSIDEVNRICTERAIAKWNL